MKIWMDRFLHHAEKTEPGSVASVKNIFHHTNVRGGFTLYIVHVTRRKI
jgi:hypothetical protein